jgi:hypothetical protein
LGDDLLKQFQVITRDGASLQDEDVKTAVKRAGKILGDLKAEAIKTGKDCEKYVLALSAVITQHVLLTDHPADLL